MQWRAPEIIANVYSGAPHDQQLKALYNSVSRRDVDGERSPALALELGPVVEQVRLCRIAKCTSHAIDFSPESIKIAIDSIDVL
jgi:hypothetical protein